jgi:hypothetical protein
MFLVSRDKNPTNLIWVQKLIYILFPVPKETGSPPTIPVPKEVFH